MCVATHLYTSFCGELIKISSLQKNVKQENSYKTDDCGPVLRVEWCQFSAEAGKFESCGGNQSDFHLEGGGTSSRITLHAVNTIVDGRTGLKVPCIVAEKTVANSLTDARDGPTRHQVFVILLLVRKRKFRMRVFGSFFLPYSLTSATKSVSTCDGPTLYWERDGILHFTKNAEPSGGETESKIQVVTLQKCFWKPSYALKWFEVMKDEAVAIATEKRESSDFFYEFDFQWQVIRIPLQYPDNVSVGPIQVGDCPLVPREYSRIVTCLSVHLSIHPYRTLGRSNIDLGGQGVVLLATDRSQLVEVCGGLVRRVCKLAFNDACGIQVAMTTGGEGLIVVHSTGRHTCAVWEKSFKIAKEWTGFCTVLVDDFLFCGAQQILLLGDCLDAPQTNFHLTDIVGYKWTSREEKDVIDSPLPDMTPCTSNLLSAVQALEGQVQEGLAELQAKELQFEAKEQLIKESCDALLVMADQRSLPASASPAKTSVFLTSFCNLFDEGTGIEMDTDPASPEAQHTKIKCLGGWQRVVWDQWVLGVDVVNETNRSVSDLCSMAVPLGSAQTSVCQFTPTNIPTSSEAGSTLGDSPSSSDEPFGELSATEHHGQTAPAFLNPGEKTTVVCSMGIPEFAAGPVVTCSVFVSWKVLPDEQRNHANGDDSVDRGSCHCGVPVLHTSDIVSGDLGINLLNILKSDVEYQRDMQALDAIQQTAPLLLTSSFTGLSCIHTRLMELMDFNKLARQEGTLIHSGPPLDLMRVETSLEGSHRMRMFVHSRDQSDVVLFCRHLCQLLPDDVTIKPLPPSYRRIRSAVAATLAALDAELSQADSYVQQQLAANQGRGSKGTDVRTNSDIAVKGQRLVAMKVDTDTSAIALSRLLATSW